MANTLLAFDWDGTLIDSIPYIVQCMDAAFQMHDVEKSKAEMRSIIGLGLREGLCRLVPEFDDEQIDLLVSDYREIYFRDWNQMNMFDGAIEMLHDLRAHGYQLAIATGKGRQGLDADLKSKDLIDFFDATRTAGETASKPDPKMVHELVDECGADHVIVIGDTDFDMQMGKNGGARCVFVNYGVHKREQIQVDVEVELSSIAELRAFLLANQL